MPLCSIIIPVHDRLELTRDCLHALACVTGDVPTEVIVVDNASTDGTVEFLAGLGSRVRTVRNPENVGFARACNQGAALARGDYLVFLNNDTIPLPGWLAALVAEVEHDAGVAVVGSRLLYPDGSLQHAGVVFSRAVWGPYHVYQRLPGDFAPANHRRELRAVTAACVLVRRTAFVAAGAFDEAYRNGFEDIELCLTIGARGGRVVYQPASVLYHLESQTPGRKAHDRENWIRLRQRWERHLLEDEDAVYDDDGWVLHLDPAAGGLHARLEPADAVPDRAPWRRVAAAQRLARGGERGALAALLHDAGAWPTDAFVLAWAARTSQRIGLADTATAFGRRAIALADARPGRLAELLATDVPSDDADRPLLAAVREHVDTRLARNPHDLDAHLLAALADVRGGATLAARDRCATIRRAVPAFDGERCLDELAERVRLARPAAESAAPAPVTAFVLEADRLGTTDWVAAVHNYLRAFTAGDPCMLWLRTDPRELRASDALARLAPALAPFRGAPFARLAISEGLDECPPADRIVPLVPPPTAWTPRAFREQMSAATG